MKKLFLSIAILALALCVNAQKNQYFWYQGHLMMGNPIAQIDSVTFGEADTDSILIYLPRTIIKTIHDTVYITIHDTVCPSDIPDGALTGEFSVSATKKVLFSKGNLQFNPVQGTHQCADGTSQQGTWRFAENQWVAMKELNDNASATYDGWLDLFAWGTSGYNGKYPYLKNDVYDDSYFINGQQDISGTMYDWGVYNEISNGGTFGTWRSLTAAEYEYIFTQRNNAGSLYKSNVTVNGVEGLLLLPDNWNTSVALSDNYSDEEWIQIESQGVVFLPYAGVRDYSLLSGTGWFFVGYYWTATCSQTQDKAMAFDSYHVDDNIFDAVRAEHWASHGRAVRLVREIE